MTGGDPITELCRQIEAAVKQPMRTPKDFTYLRNLIFARLHEIVGESTLKRIWGYIKEDVQTRRGTLDILARYLGYADYEAFEHSSSAADDGVAPSSPLEARSIDVRRDIAVGEHIRLTWLPGRECDVVYRGDFRFEVEASVNTRLVAGSTFVCAWIIDGEPLFLDAVTIPGAKAQMQYVCGKKSGVHYDRLDINETCDPDM